MKKSLQILGVCTALQGCTTVTDISTEPEFREFVRNGVTLNKQVLVCKEEPFKTEAGSYIDLRLVFNINQISKCPFGETVGILMPGSKLGVSKVEKHELVSAKSTTHIYFIGRTKLGDVSSFEYFYRYGHKGFYDNQPW